MLRLLRNINCSSDLVIDPSNYLGMVMSGAYSKVPRENVTVVITHLQAPDFAGNGSSMPW